METSHAIILFREYMGCGLIVIGFFFAMIYLFLKEEKRPRRILFLYAPAIFLFLFFNPWFEAIMNRYLKDEIYYRILWLLPMTIVIAYSVVKISWKLPEKKRMLFLVAAAGVIMVSGKYIYGNPNFSKAENLYHVPDEVVHICDAIEVPGREVTAVFPLEMVQYVRQYSPVVCMPYGREILVERWNHLNELCDEMEAPVVNAQKVTQYAKEQACVYIVLSEEKQTEGSLPAWGYDEFARIDGYVIYKDSSFVP